MAKSLSRRQTFMSDSKFKGGIFNIFKFYVWIPKQERKIWSQEKRQERKVYVFLLLLCLSPRNKARWLLFFTFWGMSKLSRFHEAGITFATLKIWLKEVLGYQKRLTIRKLIFSHFHGFLRTFVDVFWASSCWVKDLKKRLWRGIFHQKLGSNENSQTFWKAFQALFFYFWWKAFRALLFVKSLLTRLNSSFINQQI